jgi:predicted nucleic-acid-binding Zn-ribbon protein
MATTEQQLSAAFVCEKCDHQGAHVEKLSMSGTGISRLLEIQPYRYAFASEGKDDLGDILDIIFMD